MQSEASAQPFYVGTYTDGESEGIYKYLLHANGKMTPLGLAASSQNPSFLAFGPERKVLLAVNEIQDTSGQGSVESFLISGDRLKLLNRRPSGGAHPCFISVHGQVVLTANYSGGNIGLLHLDESGRLSELKGIHQHTGQGTTARQTQPHAHSVWVNPWNQEILAVDLGSNEVWVSNLDWEQVSFTAQEPSRIQMQEGAGPRHLAFHPNGNWIYVVNELDNTVSLLTSKEGYSLRGSYSTLPRGFNGNNTTAHILISADGKFLYASNRGHNSLAVFKIEDDGSLSLKGHKSTGGDGPRHFTFSPDEGMLLVANQHSNNIVSLKRDLQSGMLKYLNQSSADSPVCLLF